VHVSVGVGVGVGVNMRAWMCAYLRACQYVGMHACVCAYGITAFPVSVHRASSPLLVSGYLLYLLL